MPKQQTIVSCQPESDTACLLPRGSNNLLFFQAHATRNKEWENGNHDKDFSTLDALKLIMDTCDLTTYQGIVEKPQTITSEKHYQAGFFEEFVFKTREKDIPSKYGYVSVTGDKEAVNAHAPCIFDKTKPSKRIDQAAAIAAGVTIFIILAILTIALVWRFKHTRSHFNTRVSPYNAATADELTDHEDNIATETQPSTNENALNNQI